MTNTVSVPGPRLAEFCRAVLTSAGADAETARDCTDSMMHGSNHGVDSHGVRLLGHYTKALQGGRLNKAPKLQFTRTRAGSGMLNGDDAQGARATFAAVEHACDLAREAGIGAVGITNSSHFGPAGAYALRAAQKGMMALVTCNSDSFVRLHDGADRFHGTNPISIACPAPGNPWLLDMATSAVPYNRVELYRSLGTSLPQGVASDDSGADVDDPNLAVMLAPLGGMFGFKGAALGGVAELFSAVMTGMKLSRDIPSMAGPDFSTPRGMGAFVIALDPQAFAGAELVQAGITRYLELLRSSPARPGTRVMAPGDREWAEAELRAAEGIPLDPVTIESFAMLSRTLNVAPVVGG
ncbi:Ldh family oxidoreductase [Oceaniglobus trochenteri]|uniref:Ldh family oxidoreductase n=1 Tax=Oceaniglobus trochenteri TaxID=2763260 RepID=UPI001CFF6C83|nr:Ldh family oxidoreductase [Oceaniglobus trochenteri]